jgi:predicted anti-sigma-YlaC factor YlaD
MSMALSREELEQLMRLVGKTQEHEITCEECLMKVSEFAEHELKHKPVSDVLRAVEQHLAICGECREEFEILREAIKELG